jgi:hypothetical protein
MQMCTGVTLLVFMLRHHCHGKLAMRFYLAQHKINSLSLKFEIPWELP